MAINNRIPFSFLPRVNLHMKLKPIKHNKDDPSLSLGVNVLSIRPSMSEILNSCSSSALAHQDLNATLRQVGLK